MFSKIYNWWYGLGQYKEKIADIILSVLNLEDEKVVESEDVQVF